MNDTYSGRIAARIVVLRRLGEVHELDDLQPLAREARDHQTWDDRTRAAFTARRLALEAEWVAGADWGNRWMPGPCPGCQAPHGGVRGYGQVCSRCVRQCPHPAQRRVYGVTVLSDGGRRPVFACRACGGLIDARRTDPRCGEHVFRDLRPPEHLRDPCSRCGRRDGAQLHHWAPSAIFGYPECEQWPKAWLCQECHAIWHRAMRQAGGYRLDEDQRGRDLPSAATCGDCGVVTPRHELSSVHGLFHRNELCPTCTARAAAELVEAVS